MAHQLRAYCLIKLSEALLADLISIQKVNLHELIFSGPNIFEKTPLFPQERKK